MRHKETPEKYCQYCGKKLERKRLPNGDLEYFIHFNKRKYCDQKCMAEAFRGRIKTSNPSWYTAHRWARLIKEKSHCEICGTTKNLDVHHIDKNPNNNRKENLIVLCRSCHIRIHRPKAICAVDGCNKKVKGHGYCEKHYQRFKKYGDPLLTNRGHGHIVRAEI